MTSPYKQHVARWRGCRACSLCERRTNVVIARGRVPAEVLFVGEAPGDSEDVIGLPFVGPAGRLLDHVVVSSLGDRHSHAVTNLVGCVPRDEGNAKGEPPKEAIAACRPRLLEFIRLCRPRLVVTVGLLSQRNLPSLEDGAARVGILHPAAILRMDTSQQSLAIKRCIVAVRDAAAAHL